MAISRKSKGQSINIILARFVIRYINLFILSFLLLILALLSYFVAWPVYQGYTFFTQEEIPLLERALVQEQNNLEELKLQYQRKQEELLQVKLDKVEKLVARDNERTNIYLPIEKIVTDNNFTLNSISIRDEGLSKFGEEQIGGSIDNYAEFQVGEMDIVLDITGGGYEEIKNLLKVFENSLRLYDIVSLNFTPESFYQDSGDNQGVAYNLVLKTYYLMPRTEEEENEVSE